MSHMASGTSGSTQNLCGLLTGAPYSEAKSTLPSRGDELQEALNELIKLGWVEVVGITDGGNWLYGVTNKGLEIAELNHAFVQTFERIVAEANKEQGEEQ